MKKRLISIMLALCMVLCLVPTTAFAAGELPDVKLSVPTTFDKTVDLTEQNGELKIKDSKTYLIVGSPDPNWYFQHRIKIDGKNNTPHIFLKGVRLQAPKDGPAIELYGGASACLYFIGGDSELIGAENFAALQKNKTDGYLRVLVQTGTKLTCQGGHHGAGIGGSKVGIKNFSQGHGMNLHFGSLATDIYSGEISATSGVGGAGIGGGANGGVGEQIYVYSGKLTAISVSQGAGIGGGQGGPGRYIYIRGGTVEAGSRSAGAGIGSGDYAGPGASEDTHDIEISGGSVIAWSNYAGAGIGGGRYSSGHDISIIGGEVMAQGYWGAGIGGGMNGDGWNILIKDAELTAQSVPLYPDRNYDAVAINLSPAVAVGRGSNRSVWTTALFNPELGLWREDNIKIGTSSGKSVRLSATGWQWRRSQGQYEWDWGTTTELLIPNEYGRVDLQRLSLPYACNYGRVIGKLELHCKERACVHEFAWTDRDGCHIWACKKCGARDPAAEMSKQNAKHIPGDWGVQEMRCAVCDHLLEKDTKAPVLEVLNDGESYTVEDNIDGNPGAYTFTVSDPAASGETSSGIKSVTINGEPQDGPTYRLPAPDGGNNDAGAEYTVVATDNAGNETKATVRTYRRHHYTVTFDSTGGSEVIEKTMAVTYGEQLGNMPVPRREGYVFLGWYDALVGGKCYGGSDGKSTSPYDKDGDTTLYAQWAEAPSRMVYFNTCGGTMTGPVEVLHKLNTPIAKPSDPTKAGYTFTGWYTDSALTQAWNFDDWVTGELKLYAGWTVNQYTITFDTVGGSEIAPITQDYGTAITTPADPTREEYTFIGWDKAIPTTMPAENMTIKAQWKINQYTITFDTVGGSAIAPITQDYGTAVTAPANPTREGYTFMGWDKAIPATMPAENMTVTAQWKVNSYTITFDTAGGSTVAPITQDYGTNITAPADPTREGYTFLGWDKEIPKTMPAENMTVTAQWKDTEKPTGEIKISGNSWKTFLNNITFGLFFKDTQTVTINAADNSGETVTVEYLLSNKELTKAELDGMTFTVYTAPFGIDPDNEYIIYVKLTDTAGNTDYICSDGIVLDGTSPVITGIENGKTYCEAQTVTVDEKYIDTVKVNGNTVTLDSNNQFTLNPAEGKQTIVVTDKASNETRVIVTVNDGHTYEWQSENGQYWQKCKFCNHKTAKKDIPTINISGADKVCRTQDYKFSFTLPEGATDAACGYELIGLGDGPLTPTFEGGMYCGVIKSAAYPAEETSFKLIVSAKTADGFEFSAEKTVAIQNEHSGGTATCTEQATCEICGEKYGDLKPHSYSVKWSTGEASHWHECTECRAKTDEAEHTDTNKDHKCDVCDKVLSECTDTNKDHKCDLCGKALSEHSGGKATCKDKAKCEFCGESYGELNANNHSGLKHIDAKAATKTTEGNIEYWYCEGCGKYFSDKDGTKEIKKADTVTTKLKDDSKSPQTGDSKSPQTGDSKSPQTGDSSNFALWLALLFISGGAAIGTTVVSRKKVQQIIE